MGPEDIRRRKNLYEAVRHYSGRSRRESMQNVVKLNDTIVYRERSAGIPNLTQLGTLAEFPLRHAKSFRKSPFTRRRLYRTFMTFPVHAR